MTDSCVKLRTRGWWGEDIALHRCRVPYGPRNSWSNLSYLLAGVWVVLTQQGDVRWVMGAALLTLAIGSALYHSTKQIWANNLDWLGMGASMSVLVIHGAFPHADGLALGAFSIGAVVALLIAQHMHFDEVMGLMFLGALVPAYTQGSPALATASVICFALAYGAWQADKRRWKIVGLYGHAAWHAGTAAAMAILFAAQQP